MKLHKEKNRQQGGFTLMEILIATVILGLSYVAILQNFSQSSGSIARLEKKQREMFASVQEFERALGGLSEMDASAAASSYLDGLQYRLVLFADENQEFMTLKLVKK